MSWLSSASARVISPTPIPKAAIRSGSSRTSSWRETPPTTEALPTPSMTEKRFAITSSASTLRSPGAIMSELTATEMIGSSPGSKRSTVGSSAPSGKTAATAPILSRTSCTAVAEAISMSKIITIKASPARAVERISSTPLMVFTDSSIGSITSPSTASGDAPG
jgi:hypothetical protein